jgi:predicted aldo/keto reductase-like oxidoreductase
VKTAAQYLNPSNPAVLGFGAMRLGDDAETSRMVDAYMESGANYFDTAWIYGGSEARLNRTLVSRYPRDSFIIADKMPPWEVKNAAGCDKIFAAQLKRLGVSYIDFYLVHSLDDRREEGLEYIFEWAYARKKAGDVKHVGFSFHGSTGCLQRLLTRFPDVEFVQLQLNYADILRGPAGEWMDVANKANLPIIVMEPIKGGGLAKLPPAALEILSQQDSARSAASWAVQYAAQLPGVTCVLSGMNDLPQVQDNVNTFAKYNTPMTEAQLAALSRVLDEVAKAGGIACTACRYCHAHCPQGINISACFQQFNDLKRGGGQAWNIEMQYKTLDKNASDCTCCRACIANCPQKLDIPRHMQAVASTF